MQTARFLSVSTTLRKCIKNHNHLYIRSVHRHRSEVSHVVQFRRYTPSIKGRERGIGTTASLSSAVAEDTTQAPSSEARNTPSPGSVDRTAVVCVDYLLDGVTENELKEAFAPYAEVRNIRFDSTRVGQFLGRAYVVLGSFSDVQRIQDLPAPLQCRGEDVLVERWRPTTVPTSRLSVQNCPRRDCKDDLDEILSKFGPLVGIWHTPRQYSYHIRFTTRKAASRAYMHSIEQPFVLDDHQLNVTFVLNSPKRILRIMQAPEAERDLQEILGTYYELVTRTVRSDSGDQLVEFGSIKDAVRAQHHLTAAGLDVKFLKHSTLLSKAPPLLVPQEEKRHLIHVSNIPDSGIFSSIERMFTIKSKPPLITWVTNKAGEFTSRAFVRYADPIDCATVLQRHKDSPYTSRGQPLTLTESLAVKDLRLPSRWIMVEHASADSKGEVHSLMSKFGDIIRVEPGFNREDRFVVQYEDKQSSIRAMEEHFLNPMSINGQTLRLVYIKERNSESSSETAPV